MEAPTATSSRDEMRRTPPRPRRFRHQFCAAIQSCPTANVPLVSTTNFHEVAALDVMVLRPVALQVPLHALRTEHPSVERKVFPRLEADHFVLADLQLNAALLAAEAA